MKRVRKFLETGHARCERLLSDAVAAASAGQWNAARDAFHALVEDLEAHLAMEEDVLFPSLRRRAALGTLIKRCRLEHAELRDALAEVAFQFAHGETENLPRLLAEMTRFIATHNEREEQLVRGPRVARTG